MKTLVIGATTNKDRYAYKAIQSLIDKSHQVVAIGTKEGMALDVNIETSKLPFTGIDTVTLYLNPKNQEEYYDYIISLKPRRVLFNPGTENPVFYEILKQNNIEFEVACTLVLLATNQY
jgi:predicted CoA-binding protein